MFFALMAGGEELPAPVNIKESDQIIWSANTGRTATGKMVGTAVAKKKTFDIEWGILREKEVKLILDSMPAKFFELTIQTDDENKTYTVYRGAFQRELLGHGGSKYYRTGYGCACAGELYYRSLTVSLIEQ